MEQYQKSVAASRPDAVPEVAHRRVVPTFYVVDKAFRVVVACGPPTMQHSDALPPPIEQIVRNLMHRVTRVSDGMLGMDGNTVVRIIKPDTPNSELTCVFIETLRTRNPLGEAVERHGMTKRQAEVLKLLMQGAPNTDIALQLHIAPTTVEDHVRNIAAKTDVRTRSQIVAHVLGFL
jgi:DNA-binding CsgD family transcriptional regulator